MRKLTIFASVFLAPAFFATVSLLAQVPAPAARAGRPAPPPPLPDTAETKQHLDAAIKAAGKEWATAEKYICFTGPVRANKADDPQIKPARLFDNLYATGLDATVVYAIITSDGIVLIDAGYAPQVDTVLLPQMKQLGLDPAQVKNIIITHGHGDHFGGSRYFQAKYGTHVWMSALDWDVVERASAAAAARGGKAQAVEPPKRDMVAEEGKPIIIGDTKISVVLVPGHTPGSIGLIFPVKDAGKTRMAALYGGMFLTPTMPSMENMKTYVNSVKHWGEVTKAMKVEVEVQNHPIMDDMDVKLAKLIARSPGGPNPFVVGKAGYQRWVTVMEECEEVQILRRPPDAPRPAAAVRTN